MAEHDEELNKMAEWIVTHPPDISPDYVGWTLGDAEAPIDPLSRGEERQAALQKRADARRWIRKEAERRGYPKRPEQAPPVKFVGQKYYEVPGTQVPSADRVPTRGGIPTKAELDELDALLEKANDILIRWRFRMTSAERAEFPVVFYEIDSAERDLAAVAEALNTLSNALGFSPFRE